MKAVPFAAREARRLQAWKLHQLGWSQRAIAELLEVSAAAVSRWFKRARLTGGARGLRRRKAAGATRRLPRVRWRELRTLLRRGAEAHGFHGALWTCQRVAVLIEREFDVTYSPRHVGGLLAEMELERAAAPAPRPPAQPPVLHEWLTRDHLSVIAAVGAAGQLYCQTQEHAFDAVAVTGFLRHLLRVVPGKGLVIGDGAPIHRSRVIKAFLQAEANERLEVEAWPGYAPDLNPLDTGVWHWLKDVVLANGCAANLAELKEELRAAIARLRRKPSVIKASFAAAKLN